MADFSMLDTAIGQESSTEKIFTISVKLSGD